MRPKLLKYTLCKGEKERQDKTPEKREFALAIVFFILALLLIGTLSALGQDATVSYLSKTSCRCKNYIISITTTISQSPHYPFLCSVK